MEYNINIESAPVDLVDRAYRTFRRGRFALFLFTGLLVNFFDPLPDYLCFGKTKHLAAIVQLFNIAVR
jgi:hypothetical protein